jgi:hypothetical protein
MFDWIDQGALDDALAVIGALPPLVADAGFNLLIATIFPDGDPVLADLTDAALITMVALLATSGQRESAIAVLGKGVESRPGVTYVPKAHRVKGGSSGWMRALRLCCHRTRVGAGPLDPATHRAHARDHIAQGDLSAALNALLTGACLPIDAADKAGIGADLAAMGVYLAAIGDGDWLGATARLRLRWPPAPCWRRRLRPLWRNGRATAPLPFTARVWSASSRHGSTPSRWPRPGLSLARGQAACGHCVAGNHQFLQSEMHLLPRHAPRGFAPVAAARSGEGGDRPTGRTCQRRLDAAQRLWGTAAPPHIGEILSYIRAKDLPWPTFFTTHGMTLQPKKLKALSHNYPAGIAVSLHNDSQDSYERSRSAKIGDYDTLVSRLSDLLTQMVEEGAPTHVRMYQMVCNGREDPRVPPETRAAFANSAERLTRHVRKWEAIAARIAEAAPPERRARALTNRFEHIEASFLDASHDDGIHLPILCWLDENGCEQQAFMSPRPVGTYANLLLEYDDRWTVRRDVVAKNRCGFTNAPSLAVFATGKLGICCLDLHSTATFGSLSDFEHIGAALRAMRPGASLPNCPTAWPPARGARSALPEATRSVGLPNTELAHDPFL